MSTFARGSEYGIVRRHLDGNAAAVWDVAVQSIAPYPDTTRLRPLQPPKGSEKPRPFITAELVSIKDDSTGALVYLALLLANGFHTTFLDLTDPAARGDSITDAMAALGGRGYLCVFHSASRSSFHLFLREIAPYLLNTGWVVEPYVSGDAILGISLKRAKEQWVLCDVGHMAGIEGVELSELSASFGRSFVAPVPDVTRLWFAVDALQAWLIGTFGVGLRVTLGAVAVRAAERLLPSEPVWFRPHPLLVSLCRACGAYRGGYTYAKEWHGAAWRVDMNRAYTWSLSFPLMARAAIGPALHDGQEQPGIFLTRVEGRGQFPVYLPVLSFPECRLTKKLVGNPRGVYVLPQAEYAGIRAMGYKVTPLWGFRAVSHVDLSPLAAILAGVRLSYPTTSLQDKIAKRLANSLYGKLAEKPLRTNLAYAIHPPGEGWVPFVATNHLPIANLWIRSEVRYTRQQHIDAAACITARVRGRMYEWLAAWGLTGGDLVHADTDGMLVTADPSISMPMDARQLGAFRLEGFDPDCRVVARKWYSFLGRTYTAGQSGLTPGDLEIVANSRQLSVARRVLSFSGVGSE